MSSKKIFCPDYPLNNRNISEIFQKMKNPLDIEEIDFEGAIADDEFIIPFFEKCKNLQVVNLGCTSITNDCLLGLFKECQNITSLSISCCIDLDVTSLSRILSKNLIHLSISYLDISNETLESLTCNKLIYLDIANCNKITNIDSILKNNPDLEKLYIEGCQMLTDLENIFETCQKYCKKLNFISFTGSENIPLLQKKMPNLTYSCSSKKYFR